MNNGRVEIKATSNVVREQRIEINLADLGVEQDVDTVKVTITAYSDNGRPRSRTLIIPNYMLAEMATNRGGF